MQAAARLNDPIAHTNAMSGLIAGAVIGASLAVIGTALIVGTGGLVAPLLIGAALAGGATGAWIGEFAGSLSFFNTKTGNIARGSPDVFVNYKPLARAEADIGICSKHGPEPPRIATGSGSVFINGFPAVRVKDKLGCSAFIIEGSPDVFIGGVQVHCEAVTIEPEVSAWVHLTVMGAGIAGALLLGGWAVAPGIVGGFAVGIVGGEVMGWVGRRYGDWLSENIGGEPEDWEKAGMFVGQAIGGWLGAKGGPKAWEFARRIEVDPGSFGVNGGKFRIKPKSKPSALESKPAALAKSSNPVTREAIIDKLGEVVQKRIPEIKKLDPNARVGFRGSLARGFKGEHKGNAPFDPTDFDIDAYVISDKLPVSGGRFKVGPEPLHEIASDIDAELRQYPEFGGLRRAKLKFRIFRKKEIMQKAKKGDAQFYFIESK